MNKTTNDQIAEALMEALPGTWTREQVGHLVLVKTDAAEGETSRVTVFFTSWWVDQGEVEGEGHFIDTNSEGWRERVVKAILAECR